MLHFLEHVRRAVAWSLAVEPGTPSMIMSRLNSLAMITMSD